MRYTDGNITIAYGITISDIVNNDFVAFNVPPEDVEAGNITPLCRVLEKFDKVGKSARGKLMILFMYDDDPREIYEIPEIGKWLKKALKRNPQLFYWISNKFQNNAEMIMACLSGNLRTVRIGPLGEKTLEEWLSEGYTFEELPQNIIYFSLSDDIIEIIKDGVRKYGSLRMNDSRENIEETITDIMECLRRANPAS